MYHKEPHNISYTVAKTKGPKFPANYVTALQLFMLLFYHNNGEENYCLDKCQCQGKNCQEHEWYNVVEEMLALFAVGF